MYDIFRLISILIFIGGFFGYCWYKDISNLPDKDLTDYTLNKSSTPWIKDYYCKECKATATLDEMRSDICNDCGLIRDNFTSGRTMRQVVKDGKWVWQYRYEDGTTEITEKPYK